MKRCENGSKFVGKCLLNRHRFNCTLVTFARSLAVTAREFGRECWIVDDLNDPSLKSREGLGF